MGVSLFLLCGCGGPAPEPVKPLPPAMFDTRNPEPTFRWLIEKAKPIVASGTRSQKEQSNNPLRKEQFNEHVANAKEWKGLIDSLIGKEIVWPVYAEHISTTAVDVNLIPEKLDKDSIEVHVYMTQYPGPREHFTGRLLIGTSITLDEAKRLDRGNSFYVQGVIEKIEESVSRAAGFNSEYISMYINNTKAVLP